MKLKLYINTDESNDLVLAAPMNFETYQFIYRDLTGRFQIDLYLIEQN